MSASESQGTAGDRASSELLGPGEGVPPGAKPVGLPATAAPVAAPPMIQAPPHLRYADAGGPGISKGRLMAAFGIAVVSDLISVWTELIPPMQLTVDIATAALLFMVLGWRWPLLIGLFMEAVPGLAFLPAWVMVVGAIAVWGTARPADFGARK